MPQVTMRTARSTHADPQAAAEDLLGHLSHFCRRLPCSDDNQLPRTRLFPRDQQGPAIP